MEGGAAAASDAHGGDRDRKQADKDHRIIQFMYKLLLKTARVAEVCKAILLQTLVVAETLAWVTEGLTATQEYNRHAETYDKGGKEAKRRKHHEISHPHV